MANVNNLIMSSMINSGIFDKSIAPLLPEGQAEYIKNALVSTLRFIFCWGIERIFAMGAHIAFSILVLTAEEEEFPVPACCHWPAYHLKCRRGGVSREKYLDCGRIPAGCGSRRSILRL